MSERRTRGQGNNPGVTKKKIIELLLVRSEETPEPEIRDYIADTLGIKEPKSSKIQLAAARDEGLLLKDPRSGVNYWNINFNSDDVPDFTLDILRDLPAKDRVSFHRSPYVQEMVMKMAGCMAKSIHAKTRVAYLKTKLSHYWGFSIGEQVSDDDDDEVPEELLRTAAFYNQAMRYSPSFFLYYFNDAGGISPYLTTILSSVLFKTEWNRFDLLYLIGTMGCIVDHLHSDDEGRDEIVRFLTDTSDDIAEHTSLKYPELLLSNMVHADGMLQELHNRHSGDDLPDTPLKFDPGMFQRLKGQRF